MTGSGREGLRDLGLGGLARAPGAGGDGGKVEAAERPAGGLPAAISRSAGDGGSSGLL